MKFGKEFYLILIRLPFIYTRLRRKEVTTFQSVGIIGCIARPHFEKITFNLYSKRTTLKWIFWQIYWNQHPFVHLFANFQLYLYSLDSNFLQKMMSPEKSCATINKRFKILSFFRNNYVNILWCAFNYSNAWTSLVMKIIFKHFWVITIVLRYFQKLTINQSLQNSFQDHQ